MSKKRGPGRPKGSRNKHDVDYDDAEYAPLLSSEVKRGVGIILLLAIALLSILSLFDVAGVFGTYIKQILTYLFGWSTWIFPIATFILAYLLILPKRYQVGFINYFGLLIAVLSGNGLLHLIIPFERAVDTIATGKGGGYCGLFLSWPLQQIMGLWATAIVLVALFLIGLMITFNTPLQSLVGVSGVGRLRQWWKGKFSSEQDEDEDSAYDEDEEDQEVEETDEVEESPEEVLGLNEPLAVPPANFLAKQVPESSPFAKKFKKVDIPLDLLSDKKEKPTSGDINAGQERIRKTLETFGINVEMGEVSVGPTVTQYTLKPSEGVKLSQITTLHNDLALALAAHPIRIEAPIPGKSLVGIEVPNQTIAQVNMRGILSSKVFAQRQSNLTITLGRDVAGLPWVAQLERMPHMLVAGSTGSGKSVCVNSIIISLLYQNSPDTLRFILVDPKRVEFPVYNGIPHLMTPVITDVKKTLNALKWTIAEMDRRFELLAKAGKRDVHSYNKVAKDKIPFLVFIIDELADLMQTSGSEVEGYIVRLAQMARAVGIHLILATQRPSVDIITGLIKANITSRIAFAVAAVTDSRTILDHAGAEKLLGRGDMLYISSDLSKPKRIQGAFISEDEIRRVVEFLKGQYGEVDYDDTVVEKQNMAGISGFSDEDGDELLDEARAIVVSAGKASASLLQRRLKVGYARAARLLDLLEEQGIIGPGHGAKPREILVSDAETANSFARLPSSDDDWQEENNHEVEENNYYEQKLAAVDQPTVVVEDDQSDQDDTPPDLDDRESVNEDELV